MTADPTQSVSSVDLLDAGEHAHLDRIGNRAALTGPVAQFDSIPTVFAEQATRTPDAVALVYEDRSWTYRELEEAANRVAHRLAGFGVGAGERVALLFSRSAEAIVAILAVLKAGAAYLPIDPALPDERIGFMLADAAPMVAISTAELAPRLHASTTCRSSTCTTPRSRLARQARCRRRCGRRRLPDLHLGHHRCAQRRCGEPP
ncbi:AMP-binding enzyme family protein [Mycobacterium avium MAV_120709_2344]|nr:AMP-binding enzyme family protein [Mycobacterium avium MAV_120709_2344]